MTDKEFRRLSRADLIEIIYELQRSEKALQQENEALRRQLEDRRIAIEESGSLAEVLAKLNGLFEAAQATADEYREEAERQLEEARRVRAAADGLGDGDGRPALRRDEQKERSPRRQDGDDLDLDALIRSIKEDRYDDDSNG